MGGKIDLTYSGAVWSGPPAFAEAGVKPADIKYASIYDSFTITVLMQIEDLGFCEKGKGGKFVADGNLISGVGKLPFNTDGGGLCNNHPANRGGLTKVVEAVRQLRGEAHPEGAGARTATSRWRTAPAARSAPATAPPPSSWKGVSSHGRAQRAQDPGAAAAIPRRRRSGTRPREGKLLIGKCTACGEVHYYPRAHLPVLLQRQDRMAAGLGQRHDLHLQRDAPRAGALRDRLCDA